MTREAALELMAGATDMTLAADDPLAALGADSLELLYAVSQIEAVTDARIPDAELVRFRTVGDMAGWIAARLSQETPETP